MALWALRLEEKHMKALQDRSGTEAAWLSDEVINAFSKTLFNKIDPKAFVILTATGKLFQWFKKLTATERNTQNPIILAPVLQAGHWVLVVVNCARQVISCLTSQPPPEGSGFLSLAVGKVMNAFKETQKEFPGLIEIPWGSKTHRPVGPTDRHILPFAER
jgi:hypothetical protein